MFLFVGQKTAERQRAAERALASYTQTQREAHMALQTGSGTLSGLMNDSLCLELKSQDLCRAINGANVEIKEKRAWRGEWLKHGGGSGMLFGPPAFA